MDEAQERNGEVLNWLLQGANDSAQGFRQGADLARNPKLQALFWKRAEERERLAGQIAAEVRSFGHPPVAGGTILGEAHRAFTHLRDAISQDSDRGLVVELLRRERAICAKFQAALEDTRLPTHARDVATNALPTFAQTADELAKVERDYSGASAEGPTIAGHFKLSDADNRFLEAPKGSAVLSSGSSGTDSSIERSEDTVVRIGIQSIAVATSHGGSLSVAIEAGETSAAGRDGPAPVERHLAASQSVEVLVRAGAALRFTARAIPDDAQVLRTVVWSMDAADTTAAANEAARGSSTSATNSATAEDIRRANT